MEISYIEHIGLAVKSIEDSRKYYEDVLGLGWGISIETGCCEFGIRYNFI